MSALRFKFKINSHLIGNHLYKIAQIENPEALFEDFLNNSSANVLNDEQIPYWGELWPSALVLSQFISENQSLVKGKKILEIGCGLALPGIVAGKCGGDITLTDYLADALSFAEYNWKLNSVLPCKSHLLDWRNPGKTKPADVLIASDIAYESRSFIPILNALKIILNKNGIILLSEPNRKFAKDFFSVLKEEGFDLTKQNKKIKMHNIDYTISVYVIKRSV